MTERPDILKGKARLKDFLQKAEAAFAANNYNWSFFKLLMGLGLAFVWLLLATIGVLFIGSHTLLSTMAVILVGCILSFLWLPLAVAAANNGLKKSSKAKPVKKVSKSKLHH